MFIGGLPYQLTEGDVICMFSQYGEVVHINLIRDHTSGKSKVNKKYIVDECCIEVQLLSGIYRDPAVFRYLNMLHA